MPAKPPPTAAQNRLLATLLGQVRLWLERSPLVSRVTPATITSVTAGGASDGNALVVISWRGASISVPYVSTYTPVVSHVVAVAKTGPQLLILGRIVGTP